MRSCIVRFTLQQLLKKVANVSSIGRKNASRTVEELCGVFASDPHITFT